MISISELLSIGILYIRYVEMFLGSEVEQHFLFRTFAKIVISLLKLLLEYLEEGT